MSSRIKVYKAGVPKFYKIIKGGKLTGGKFSSGRQVVIKAVSESAKSGAKGSSRKG